MNRNPIMVSLANDSRQTSNPLSSLSASDPFATFASPESGQSNTEIADARAAQRAGVATDLDASTARLTASLELMSGFGAPARTATPMPDLANTDNDARPALTARVGTKHPAPSLEWATGWKDYHKWLCCTSIVPRR